jgi:DNA replication protein DnaC
MVPLQLHPENVSLVQQKIEPRRFRAVAEIDNSLRDKMRLLIAGTEPWPLFLYGPAGCGKTRAALCVIDLVGTSCIYYTLPQFAELLIRSQQGRLEWSNEGRGGLLHPENLWAKISTAPLTVLDEIGCKERVSDHQYQIVKNFLDEREYKPAIFISNLAPEAVGKLFDDRVLSRLCAGTVFHLQGSDRRIA